MKTSGRINYKPTVRVLWCSGIHFAADSGVVKAGGGQMFLALLHRDGYHLVLFAMDCLFVLSL
jgi:hypothetical protein